MNRASLAYIPEVVLTIALAAPLVAYGATVPTALPGLDSLSSADGASNAIRLFVLLTLLSVLPAIVMAGTAFIRIVIVLAMLRHGLGMPETPPNPILVSLALFLTLFTMMPTVETVNARAVEPFLDGKISAKQFVENATPPLKEFMLRQVRDEDLSLMHELSKKERPSSREDVGMLQLVPSFILNELRVAFQMGFVILLPFLLIDLVVSSVLLALGMMMVPPSTISLPLKVLLFVLIDGWALVLRGLVGSFR